MRISVVCNFLSSFFLTAQHSAPYTMAGFKIDLYTLSLDFVCMFLSHIRDEYKESGLKGALYRIWCGVNRLGDSGVKVV